MAIFELAPAIRISTKIVKAQTNKAVLRLAPEIKNGEVANDRTFIVFLATIFTAGLLSLLVINTALALGCLTASMKHLNQRGCHQPLKPRHYLAPIESDHM